VYLLYGKVLKIFEIFLFFFGRRYWHSVFWDGVNKRIVRRVLVNFLDLRSFCDFRVIKVVLPWWRCIVSCTYTLYELECEKSPRFFECELHFVLIPIIRNISFLIMLYFRCKRHLLSWFSFSFWCRTVLKINTFYYNF